jgi:hypothetical protein
VIAITAIVGNRSQTTAQSLTADLPRPPKSVSLIASNFRALPYRRYRPMRNGLAFVGVLAINDNKAAGQPVQRSPSLGSCGLRYAKAWTFCMKSEEVGVNYVPGLPAAAAAVSRITAAWLVAAGLSRYTSMFLPLTVILAFLRPIAISSFP